MHDADALASVLVDEALAVALIPWPCPSDFGPAGRYRLEELVGAGRSSLVYRATDTHLSSEGFPATVAIKVARHAGGATAEALAARRVNHPNVLRVLDRGVEPGGCGYVVTEFVDGGDLRARPGPWKPRAAAEFLSQLARAVHASHSAGVVHCDLKPANVLLTAEGHPKLADFDLARSVVADAGGARGNVAFMSPEQFAGEPDGLTPPSDIYALGGLLFHLLSGRLPNGETAELVAIAHARAAPPPPLEAPRDLARICGRALARAREERYESAASMARDLERWLRFEPLTWGATPLYRRAQLWCRRRPYRAAAAVGAALLLAATLAETATLVRSAQRERRTRELAQEESVRRTQEQVAEIQSRVRAHIRSVAQTILATKRGDQPDRMLPTLVWLQWIADVPVIGPDGRIAVASERIVSLRGMVEAADSDGRSGDLDVKLARFALAHFLLLDGQTVAAAELLPRIGADWSGLLRPEDPVQMAIAAMQSCAAAELDCSRSPQARAAELRLLEERLRATESAEPARRLVAKVAGRLAPGPVHDPPAAHASDGARAGPVPAPD